MPTDAEIRAWALGIGFDDPVIGLCVGRRYAREHAGQLPGRDALCVWANATGVRQADGSWMCEDTVETPADMTDTTEQRVIAWVKANPMLSAIVGLLGLRVVFGFSHSRRR